MLVMGMMAGFVGCNADGRYGSGAVDRVGKPDHIGFGIVMICQIAADPLDPDTPDTVGRQYPLSGFRTGEAADGIDLGIFIEGGLDRGTGEHRQNQAGQNDHKIRPIKTVIVIGHGIAPFAFSLL